MAERSTTALPLAQFFRYLGLEIVMKPLIFAVEDDPAQARLLRYTLEAEDFTVKTFATAEAMLSFASDQTPSVFLLDIGLPDMNGLDLCREMRQSPQWCEVPVIFVSGRASVGDRVAGLALADDYICKPFGLLELVARVHAVLRRCRRPPLPAQLAVGDLELNPDSRTALVRGQDVALTAMEFDLLAYLARNVGRVCSRDHLLDAVWNRFVSARTIDVYMRRLRKKIEVQPNSPCYLRTLRGRGYRLAPPLGEREGLTRSRKSSGSAQAAPGYPQSLAS